MRKTLFAAFILAVFVCVDGYSAGQRPSAIRSRIEHLRASGRERVIILLKGGVDIDRQKARFGAKRRLRRMNALVAEVSGDRIKAIRADEAVEAVVIDQPVQLIPPALAVTAKAALSGQDGLATDEIVAPARWNIVEKGVNSLAAMQNYGLDGKGLKIAFIDSGANYSLADIRDNYLGGIDYVGDDTDPFSNNPAEYHASTVISLAVGEGKSQMLGVAPGAGYYLARVTDESFTALISDIISAMEWAMDPDGDPSTDDGADIISMSLGTYGGGTDWDVLKDRWEQLCDEASEEGIVVVSSSGNDGSTISTYPAAFSSVISVGASDEDQNVWNNYINASNGGVDVVAPGADVVGLSPDGGLVTANGTSFAAPHVSGLMALQKQYEIENSMTANTAYNRAILTHSAVDLGETMLWQGSGKAYAAATDANDPNDGAIDLLAGRWPLVAQVEFAGQAFSVGGQPVYRYGADVLQQNVRLTNITDVLGNAVETAQNVGVSVIEVRVDTGQELVPAASVFPPVTWSIPAGADNSASVGATFAIDSSVPAGLYETKVALTFSLTGGGGVIEVSYIAPGSQWRVARAGDLDADGDVDFEDFAIAASQWGRTDCQTDDSCSGADINGDHSVNYADLEEIAENWLVGAD